MYRFLSIHGLSWMIIYLNTIPGETIECIEDGMYLKNDQDSICTLCEVGKYNQYNNGVTARTCRLCAPGTYQSNTGSRDCDTCDKGTFNDIAGFSLCFDCDSGQTTYNILNNVVERGMTYCVPCPDGKYLNTENECVPCASLGKTFCKDGYEQKCTIPIEGKEYTTKPCDLYSDAIVTSCNVCLESEYTKAMCAGNLDTKCARCSNCTDGEYIFSKCSSTMDTVCSPCNTSAGDMMIGSGKCSPCPPGSMFSVLGNDCVLCGNGTFSALANATHCTPCPLGFISGVGASRCVKNCGDGFYSPTGSVADCVLYTNKFKASISSWDPTNILVSSAAPIILYDNQISHDHFLIATKRPFNYASEVRVLTQDASRLLAGNVYYTSNISDGKGDSASFALITSMTLSSSSKMHYLLTEVDASKKIGYLRWFSMHSIEEYGEVTQLLYQAGTLIKWVRPEQALYDAWHEKYLVMDGGLNAVVQIAIDENSHTVTSSTLLLYTSPQYGIFNPISITLLNNEGTLMVLDNNVIVSTTGILDKKIICGGGWKKLSMIEGVSLPCDEVDFSASGARHILLTTIDDDTDRYIVYVLLTSSQTSAVGQIILGQVPLIVSICWLITANEDVIVTASTGFPLMFIPTFSTSRTLKSLYMVESTGVISRISGGAHLPNMHCLCDGGLYCDPRSKQCLDAPLGTYTEGVWASEAIKCPERTRGMYAGGNGKSEVCRECPIGYMPNNQAWYCRSSCEKGFVYDDIATICLSRCDGMYHDTLHGKCLECWLGSEATGGQGVESCIPCSVGKYGKSTGVCETCPSGTTTWSEGSTICMPDPTDESITIHQKICADGLSMECPPFMDTPFLMPMNASTITASIQGIMYMFTPSEQKVSLLVLDTVSLQRKSLSISTHPIDIYDNLQVCDSCKGNVIFHAGRLGTCIYKTVISDLKVTTEIFKGDCGLEGQPVNGLLPKIHSMTLMESDRLSPIIYISTFISTCVEILAISTYDASISYFASRDALKYPISLLNNCIEASLILGSSKGTNSVLYAAYNFKLYATQVTGIDAIPERFLNDDPIFQVGGVSKIASLAIQHKSSTMSRHHVMLVTEAGDLHSIPISAYTAQYQVTIVIPSVHVMGDILLIGRRLWYASSGGGDIRQILISNLNGCVGGYVIPPSDKSIQGICLQGGRGLYTDFDGILQSCPIGTFGTISGAALLVHCETCPDGTVAPFAGSASCQACPPGSFTDPYKAACISKCPLGTYRVMNSCVACQAGYTSISQEGICIPCSEGTYSDSSTSWQCVLCPSGYTSPKGAHNCVRICSSHSEDTCALDGEHCISLSKQYKVLSQIFTSNTGQQMVGVAVDKIGGVFYTNGYNIRYYFDDCPSYLDVCNKQGDDLLQANKYSDYSFSALAICNEVVMTNGLYSRTLFVSSITYSSVFSLQVFQDINGKVDIEATITGPGLTLFAGSRWAGFADGPFTSAIFNQPADLEINGKCTLLYLSDFFNHKIRLLNITSGVVSTVAGSGKACWKTGSAVCNAADAQQGCSNLNDCASVYYPVGIGLSVDEKDLYIAANTVNALVKLTDGKTLSYSCKFAFNKIKDGLEEKCDLNAQNSKGCMLFRAFDVAVISEYEMYVGVTQGITKIYSEDEGQTFKCQQIAGNYFDIYTGGLRDGILPSVDNTMPNSLVNIPFKMAFAKDRGVLYFADLLNGAVRRVMVKNACVCPVGTFLLPKTSACYNPSPTWSKKALPICASGFYALDGDATCFRKCSDALQQGLTSAPCLILPGDAQFSSLSYTQLLGDLSPPQSSMQADWYGTVRSSFMYSWNSIFQSTATYSQGKIPGRAPFGRNFVTMTYSLVSGCWFEEKKFDLLPIQMLPGLWFPCQSSAKSCTCSDAITTFEKLPSTQAEKEALLIAPKRWQALRSAASLGKAIFFDPFQKACDADDPYKTQQKMECTVQSRSMFMISGCSENGSCFPALYHKQKEASSQMYTGLGYTMQWTEEGPLSCYLGWPTHSYCPNGYTWIVPSPPSSFKTCNAVSNQITCISCLPGTFAYLESSEKIKTGGPYACQQCKQGTFTSAVGASVCLTCPVGKYSSYTGASHCESCAAGKYTVLPRAYSESQCVNCLPGTGNCSACVEGTYQNSGGEIRCLITPPGFYTSEVNASHPTHCAPGYYQDSAGQSSCMACGIASFTQGYGATVCETCSVGINCSMALDNVCGKGCGLNKYWDGVKCERCPRGTMNAYETCAMDAEYCWQNPRMDYFISPQTQDITPCPYGSEANAYFDACILCDRGYYSDGTTHGCKKCKQGTYSSQLNSSSCILCEIGKSMKEEGNAFCEICPKGTYSPNVGSVKCLPCPMGQYSNLLGSTFCELCTFGKFNQEEKMSECNETCDDERGYYSLPGDTFCRYCDVGVINISLSCQGCGLGQYLMVDESGNRSCEVCPIGTVNLFNTSAVNMDICTRCSSITAYALSSVMCVESAIGHVPNTTNNGQIACPRGTIRNSTMQICTPCSMGTYADNEGGEKCSDCIPGKYSNAMGREVCSFCPSGKISMEPAATLCIGCPEGTYSINGNNCSLCPENTYSNSPGQSRCLSCSLTTFSNMGAKKCSTCPEWKVLNSQRKCDLCPPGKYMTQDAMQIFRCLVCRPGKYMNYASAGDTCTECSNGTVSLVEGASECTPCPLGTYSITSTECKACDIGKYGLGCIDCMPGTSNPLKGSAYCNPCAQGYYQDVHGQSACKPCPPGTFSNSSGSNICLSCLVKNNAFNDEYGMSDCAPKKISCEIGEYLNHTDSTTRDHGCVLCLPCAANQLTIILNKITGTGNLILYDNEQISLFSSQVCNGKGEAPFYQCVDNIPRAGEYLSFDTRVGDSGSSVGSALPFDFRQCHNPKYNDKLAVWVSGRDIKQCYVSCLYGIVTSSLKNYSIKYSGDNQNIEDAVHNLFLERMLDDIISICMPCPLLSTCPRGRFRPRGVINTDCGPTCGIPPICSAEETVTGCTGRCTNAPLNADYVGGTQALDGNECPWICNPGWHLSDDLKECQSCPEIYTDSSALCGSNDYVVLPKEQCLYWHTSRDLCKPCPHIANGNIIGWDQTCKYQCLSGYFLRDGIECISCTSVNSTLCPVGTFLDQQSCFLHGDTPICKNCEPNPSITFTSNGGLNASQCRGICAPGFHTITMSTGAYFSSMSKLQLLPYASDVLCLQCTPNDQRSCLRSNTSACFEGYYHNISIDADQLGSCVPCKRQCSGSQFPTLCSGNEIVDATCIPCPDNLLKDSTQQYTTKQFISYTEMAYLVGQAQLQVISRDFCPRVCLNNFVRDPSNNEECITCKSISFERQKNIDPTKLSTDNQCLQQQSMPPCSFIFSHWNATPSTPWWDTMLTPWMRSANDMQRAGICWSCPDGTTTSVNDRDLCTFIPGYISPSANLPIARDPIPSLPADVSMVWKSPPVFNSIQKKKKLLRRLLVDQSINITLKSVDFSNEIIVGTKQAKPCPHGYYKPSAGEGQCFACPIGSSTVSEGSISKESCMCKYGYYRKFSENGYFCLPCPVDTYGNASISVMSAPKQIQCTACPPNQTTYDNEGATTCVCALGMIMDSETKNCVLCPKNYYCKPCDNDTCLGDGISLIPCFPDASSPAGSYGIENCSCRIGMVKKSRPRNLSQLYCQKIPMGGEFNLITGEIVCKRGWSVVSKAADGSVSECALCPQGHYASIMQSSDSKEVNIIITPTNAPLCTPCPKGFYISSRYGIGLESCTVCPSNQMTRGNGAISLQDCFCPPSMKKDPVRGICIGCTPTQYVDPLNDTICKDCPVNSLAETGANSMSNCLCNAGYYSLYTSTEFMRCVLCPVGTFSAYASNTGDCTPCPEGSTTYRSGSTRLSSCGENQVLCKPGYSWRMSVGCFKT